MTVYDYVKNLANQHNMPISEVEKKCNLGNATIKSWEKSFPKVDKLYPVAKFFGVPLEYFLNGETGELDPMEQVLIDSFRSVDEIGKMRIIQVSMNEKDRMEISGDKASTESNVG